MPIPIRLKADVQIHAASKPRGPRRFSALAYTGGPLSIAGYDLPVVVDLAGLTARRVVQANLDHDPSKRVGQVDQVSNDGQQLGLAGYVSAASESAAEFLASADQGYQWQASVEVAPQKLAEIAAGETIQVNGREQSGPLYVTRSGTLHGVAFLAAGADDNTTVTIAANRRGRTMSFKNWMQSINLNAATMTENQLAAVHANYAGRETATDEDRAAVAPMIAAAATDPVAAEDRRLAQIEAATRGDWGPLDDKVAKLRAAAVGGDLTVDELLERTRKVRIEVMEARCAGPIGPYAPPSLNGREAGAATSRVIEAALCQAVGVPKIEDHYDERTLEAAHQAYRGQIGLQQILLQAAAANGMQVRPGDRVSNGNIREVLAHALPPIHAGGFSTLSVPGILSNAANKSLLAGWEEGDTTWRQVAAVKPVNDFKQATSYRLLDSLEYEQVAPDGEIKHGHVSEESYTRQAATYGIMHAITRVDIVNDDLGAFDDMRVRIGRGALGKFNDIFWTRFLNNGTFFTAGNGNYIEGGATNLGVDGVGLQAGVLKFRQMTSSDGKSIDGEPTLLLVPPELEFAARRLYQSTNLSSTGGTDAEFASANVHGGLYKPLIQPRLSNALYTGNSATAWYLLRPPTIGAVVCVSFLNGNQNPTVDTAEADFNTLGIQMRGFHDFGADLTVDYPAGVRSKGAA